MNIKTNDRSLIKQGHWIAYSAGLSSIEDGVVATFPPCRKINRVKYSLGKHQTVPGPIAAPPATVSYAEMGSRGGRALIGLLHADSRGCRDDGTHARAEDGVMT